MPRYDAEFLAAVGFQAFDTLRRELMASAYQFPINRSAFGWFGMEFLSIITSALVFEVAWSFFQASMSCCFPNVQGFNDLMIF